MDQPIGFVESFIVSGPNCYSLKTNADLSRGALEGVELDARFDEREASFELACERQEGSALAHGGRSERVQLERAVHGLAKPVHVTKAKHTKTRSICNLFVSRVETQRGAQRGLGLAPAVRPGRCSPWPRSRSTNLRTPPTASAHVGAMSTACWTASRDSLERVPREVRRCTRKNRKRAS